MTRSQIWILLAVLLTFVAGGVAGLLVAGVFSEPTPLSLPYSNYEKRLSRELQLDGEERDLLRRILLEIQRSEDDVKSRHAKHMEEDLGACARQGDRLMREFVSCLTKDRQLRYEQLLKARN